MAIFAVFFIAMFVLVIVLIALSISRQRYHDAGEETDYRNVQDYGHPAKSLYTSSKILSLHHRIEITDGREQVLYRAETKFPSIHDKTDIYRADGTLMAHIERKLLTLHEIHYIDMAKGSHFQLSNEILHIIRDVTNIEGLGWILEGNFLQLNFTLRDQAGDLIATVGQKAMSIHDKYSVDIYRTEYEEETIAILVALQHMICDRTAAASGSTGGASASGS
ncbi:MAG: LURP-one-related family protein [Eubacterium sp.]|nr:LURP-one-related family protein [Eubacterium sp.]